MTHDKGGDSKDDVGHCEKYTIVAQNGSKRRQHGNKVAAKWFGKDHHRCCGVFAHPHSVGYETKGCEGHYFLGAIPFCKKPVQDALDGL
jgi:hypothetical protein